MRISNKIGILLMSCCLFAGAGKTVQALDRYYKSGISGGVGAVFLALEEYFRNNEARLVKELVEIEEKLTYASSILQGMDLNGELQENALQLRSAYDVLEQEKNLLEQQIASNRKKKYACGSLSLLGFGYAGLEIFRKTLEKIKGEQQTVDV